MFFSVTYFVTALYTNTVRMASVNSKLALTDTYLRARRAGDKSRAKEPFQVRNNHESEMFDPRRGPEGKLQEL